MHVRGCVCDECTNPGLEALAPVRVTHRERRARMSPIERKREQNARAYQKRKLRGAAT